MFPGAILGYTKSIEVIIMSQGGTYNQQTILSLTAYAQFLKFFFAPLIDSYHLNSLGKNKTYITIVGTLAGLIVLCMSQRADQAVSDQEITLLTSFWLFVNILANLQHAALESWTLSIIEIEGFEKYISVMLTTGFSAGFTLAFNIFTWLNGKDSTPEGQDKPLVSHKLFCYLTAGHVILVSLYVLFFIKEKRVELEEMDEGGNREDLEKLRHDERTNKLSTIQEVEEGGLSSRRRALSNQNAVSALENNDPNAEDEIPRNYEVDTISEDKKPRNLKAVKRKSLKHIFTDFFPKMFRNRPMRNFVLYLLLVRMFFELFKKSLDLRLVELGLPRQLLAKASLSYYPTIVVGGLIGTFFMTKGTLLRKCHFAVLVDFFVLLHKYYLTWLIRSSPEATKQIFWQLLLNKMVATSEQWMFFFWFTHLNQSVSDYAYGSTILGVFTSVNNYSTWGFNTIGLKIIAVFQSRFGDFGYDFFVLGCSAMQFLVLCLTWVLASELDGLDKEEYRIVRDGRRKQGDVIELD